jgi:hypothetical protein
VPGNRRSGRVAVVPARVRRGLPPPVRTPADRGGRLPSDYFSLVPADRRSWQAVTTRAAIPASADLPYARGS